MTELSFRTSTAALPKPLSGNRKPIVHLWDGNTYKMLASAREPLVHAYGMQKAEAILAHAMEDEYDHVWKTLARYARLRLDVQAGLYQWEQHAHLAEAFYDSERWPLLFPARRKFEAEQRRLCQEATVRSEAARA